MQIWLGAERDNRMHLGCSFLRHLLLPRCGYKESPGYKCILGYTGEAKASRRALGVCVFGFFSGPVSLNCHLCPVLALLNLNIIATARRTSVIRSRTRPTNASPTIGRNRS